METKKVYLTLLNNAIQLFCIVDQHVTLFIFALHKNWSSSPHCSRHRHSRMLRIHNFMTVTPNTEVKFNFFKNIILQSTIWLRKSEYFHVVHKAVINSMVLDSTIWHSTMQYLHTVNKEVIYTMVLRNTVGRED